MQVTKRSAIPFGIGLALLIGFSSTAKATETNTVAFQLATYKEPLLGREPVTRASLSCGNKRFTFLVPNGYRVDASDPAKVVLTSGDFRSYITLRAANLTCGEKAPQETECKARLLEKYPEANIIEEFTSSAGGFAGPAFDLRSKTEGGAITAARVAYIPGLSGALEFSLVTSPEQFGKSLGQLHSVMLTFRASEVGGKVEVAALSDRL